MPGNRKISAACGSLAGAVLLGWMARGLAGERAASQTLIPQFENDAVMVWKTILAPHEALGMHRHEHGRVVVALEGGTLALPQDDGTSKRLVLETGKAYWLPADPPGRLHGDANQSDHRITMMVVEMKTPK
jgi:quercetin dioxygenase-like cupin family protein